MIKIKNAPKALGIPFSDAVKDDLFVQKIDLSRNNRGEIMDFRAKTMKREEVNTCYSSTSGELFAAEKPSLQQISYYVMGLKCMK